MAVRVDRAAVPVLIFEVVLLVAVSAVVVMGTVLERPSMVTVVWAAVLTVPLLWRRTRPDLVMGVLVLAGAGQLLWADSVSLANVTMLLGLYSTARHGVLWRSVAWLAVVVCGCMAATVDWTRDEVGYVTPQLLQQDMVFLGGTLVAVAAVVWMAGHLVRVSNARRVERAAAATAAREQEVRLAVAAVRAEIGREVHDIVGHALALIAVQADGGRYVATAPGSEVDLPAEERLRQAGDVLEGIRSQASAALDETRALVRDIGGTSADSQRPRPAHGIDDIPALAEEVHRSGRLVELDLDTSDFADTGAATQAAIYRVVQEALTNAVKHSGRGPIRVTAIRPRDREITIHVTNDMNGPAAAIVPGRGLSGMRERVTALGGSLQAAPTSDGQFNLTATFPLRGAGGAQ